MTFAYKKLFNPQPGEPNTGSSDRFADRAPAAVYVYADEIVLAVNVAMATGRPLLIHGPSGSGKSSLAKSVAGRCELPYIETVVTSRTQARDLQWQVDLLKRLQDAQSSQLSPDWRKYITPGLLWWAFDPRSANEQVRAVDGGAIPEGFAGYVGATEFSRAVVLIDEIDKADPDVPNNLLKPLGDLSFTVEEIGLQVETRESPLVFITTNEERDLPVAFLRRCVELDMPPFDFQRLTQIGRVHLIEAPEALIGAVAEFLLEKSGSGDQAGPNAAEYLDMVRACMTLGISPDSEEFEKLSDIVLMQRGKGR